MAIIWLLTTFSCFGIACLQYIPGEPGQGPWDAFRDADDLPPSYVNYPVQPAPHNEIETDENFPEVPDTFHKFYQRDEIEPQLPTVLQRSRRLADVRDAIQWAPNVVDADKTVYAPKNDMESSPLILQGYTEPTEGNATGNDDKNTRDKKSFSPWGGKRDKPGLEYMWTWKRAANIREPTMPKRVRFSPWGGKRTGQMIYKPGTKSSKLVSNYTPVGVRLNVAGMQFVPALDKHRFQILSLSTKMDEKSLREALPFKEFVETLPKLFKPGHPYADVNLRKDGKRKVKFSTWGGKRSPPIIGPIWTPAKPDFKESILDALLLITKNKYNDILMTKTT